MMLCDDFNTKLQAYLDDHQSPTSDPALLQHASACDACRPYLHLEAVVLSRLPDLNLSRAPDVETGRHQIDRVVSSKSHLGVRLRRSRIGRSLVASVVAATCMLGFFSYGKWSRDAHEVNSNLLTNDPSHVTRDESRAIEFAISKDMIKSVPFFDAMAQRNFASLMTTELPNLPDWSPPKVTGLIYNVGQHPEWVELPATVASPFRPVAHSVVTALDVIRQTLPGTQSSSTTSPGEQQTIVTDQSATLA